MGTNYVDLEPGNEFWNQCHGLSLLLG